MSGISNKTLTMLILAAIAVSVSGTLVTMNMLSQIALTGMATGEVNVSVASSTTITILNSSMNFGTMQVGASNSTDDGSPAAFIVRNDGSVLVNVNLTAENLWNATSAQNPTIYFEAACNDSEDLCNVGSPTGVWFLIPVSTNTTWGVISRLNFTDANDTMEVEINVTVPPGQNAGARGAVVTFTAYAS